MIDEILQDFVYNLNNSNQFYELIMYFIEFQSGYIRYDYDAKNKNGKIHPLHHFDLSYCNYTTYKFGLK